MKRQTMEEELIPLQPRLQRKAEYQERLVKWNPCSMKNLALCYEFKTGHEAETLELIPDACMDFVFSLSGCPSAVISGVQSAPRSILLQPDTVYFGFKPYTSKGMKRLNLSWAELVNTSADLRDQLACDGLLERMVQAQDFNGRVDAMCSFAAAELVDTDYTPDFVEYSELKLCNARGNLRVEDIADFTGYSGRYCREKFKEANGMSIKRYSNIIRFQNAMRMLTDRKVEDLSDIVFENGYFDQPHLSREFKLYAGDSPLHYRQSVLRMA